MMLNELRDRRTAEVVHKHYLDLLTQEDALKALAACGAPSDAERLHAAIAAYDGYTHQLAAIFGPVTATEAGDMRWRECPPLTQTPPPAQRIRHVF